MPAPKLQPALLGGLFIGVLSALPLVNVANCCCLWLVTGGMLAAWIVQQNHPAPIRVSDGVVVGFLAGVAGAFVYLLVSWPITIALGPLLQAWSQRLLEGTRDIPPEMRDALERFGSGNMSVAIGFVMNLLLGMVFSTVGGLLGAVLFRSKPAGAAPPPPPPVWPPTDRWTPPPPPGPPLSAEAGPVSEVTPPWPPDRATPPPAPVPADAPRITPPPPPGPSSSPVELGPPGEAPRPPSPPSGDEPTER